MGDEHRGYTERFGDDRQITSPCDDVTPAASIAAGGAAGAPTIHATLGRGVQFPPGLPDEARNRAIELTQQGAFG
jgi:hypothetical protein